MSHDTLIHRIVRPAVRMVSRSGVTPNHLTALRLLTGLTAAWAFSMGAYEWMSVGGAVFLVSMLLDRADGELARQTGRMSPAGHRFDLAADFTASVAAFIGLGFGVASQVGWIGLWLGLVAAGAVAALFFELNVLKVGEVRGFPLFGGRVTVDPDDAMILVPVLVWCGLAWPMLITAAVVAPVASVALFGLAGRRNRATNRTPR